MKRCVLGAVLLLVLLWLSLTAQKLGAQAPREMARQIHSAAESALEGNWDKASVLTDRALARWQKNRSFQILLHGREKLQKIDILFAELGARQAAREAGSFGAACLSLEIRAGELYGDPEIPFLWPGQ